MVIGQDTQTPQPQDSATSLPGWLRDRYADALACAHKEAMGESLSRLEPVGVIADRRIRAILAKAEHGKGAASAATTKAYLRDHARMLADGQTPLDKASTFQHFNRLRSAFRHGEAEAIVDLRRKAEAARKAKRMEDMRRLTTEAFERATVLDALFLADDHPVWSQKSAALRADGKRPSGKSKRSAGRLAPTPDQLLVAIGNQRGRASRVELFAACFALFGIRPAELVKGVEVIANGDGLRLLVTGAKVDAQRGQQHRELDILPTRLGQSELAVKVLRAAAQEHKGAITATEADIVAVRRAMRVVQAGLSPYAYRHARASDVKASHGRKEVAAWLGHATDRTQSSYGSARSRSGAVTVKAATASRVVRTAKTLPPTPAQRLVNVLARCSNPRNLSTPSAPDASKPTSRPHGPR